MKSACRHSQDAQRSWEKSLVPADAGSAGTLGPPGWAQGGRGSLSGGVCQGALGQVSTGSEPSLPTHSAEGSGQLLFLPRCPSPPAFGRLKGSRVSGCQTRADPHHQPSWPPARRQQTIWPLGLHVHVSRLVGQAAPCVYAHMRVSYNVPLPAIGSASLENPGGDRPVRGDGSTEWGVAGHPGKVCEHAGPLLSRRFVQNVESPTSPSLCVHRAPRLPRGLSHL